MTASMGNRDPFTQFRRRLSSPLPCPHRRRSFTTGVFSAAAGAYVDYIDPKVVLIDGRRLAELMIDFDVGVNAAPTYSIKRVDSDYFDDSGAV